MSAEPGWRPMPDGSQRYWDGQAWGEPVWPQGPGTTWVQAPAHVAVKRRRKWPWIVAAVVVAIIALGATAAAIAPKRTLTSAPTSSTSGSSGGKAGSTITLDGNTPGEQLAVTEVQYSDNERSDNSFETPKPGYRYYSVQYRLLNTGSVVYSDAPMNGAKVIDSQGQQFDATIVTTSLGADFNGDVKLAPGQTALGVITFEVPTSSTIVEYQFSMDSGFGSTGQWK